MTNEEAATWEPFLNSIPLFSGLAREDVLRVAGRMQQLSLPKGSALYSQGDEPNAFYIITSGQVRLVRAIGRAETVDAFLGRGETLGEGGLMTGEPRNNTARLDTTCEFLKLKRTDFEEVLRENPAILLHLSQILARRLVRADSSGASAQAQLIAFGSGPKPEAGVLFCAHLALQLVSQTRRRVLLIDFALPESGLARALGLPDGATRIPPQAQDRDPSWVVPQLRRHPSGLALLSIPAPDLGGRPYSGLYRLLNFLRESHDLILMRLGDPPGDVERTVLAESDHVLLAGGPAAGDAAELRAAVPETGRILELWLGEAPPGEPSGRERAFVPWPSALGERFSKTGSPYAAMDGQPRTLRALESLARRLGGLRVGLALGAGAALGHSYIGMLRVFAREHIPVDVVAGTSAGALIGAWLASGMSPEEMAVNAMRMDKYWLYENLFLDLTVPRAGLFGGQTLLRYLRGFFGEREFSQLELPFACVATNIETGEEVVLREGRVAEAVRASCGLPMIFTPIEHNGRFLVDGGLVDPVPTRVAAKLGADILLAVNLTLPAGLRNTRRPRRREGLLEASLELDFARLRELTLPAALKAPNMFQVVLQTLHTMEYEIARSRAELAHVAIEPDLSDFQWTETHRSREIIQAGERVAEQYVPQIKALLPFFTQLSKVPRPPASPLRG
ncbi:MAG: patatin-like phospholipase family protein [Elusimicrobia bacterium]|nr:patatin-like phospholipase family protein [Elusimicrobiota bacterium]